MQSLLDSLDLDHHDDVAVFEAVEAAFDLSPADKGVEWLTVGHVHRAILARMPPGDTPGKCATSMSFYRLRRALAPRVRGPITPATRLNEAGLTPKDLGPLLEAETGLQLQVGAAGWPMMLGLLMILAGLLLSVVLRDWRYLLLLPASYLPLRLDTGDFGRQTVGDLARQAAVANFAALVRDGADHRPDRIWLTLRCAIAETIGVKPDRIGPDTRFYPAR
ncbi:MAG TPA: hypothetical protein VEA44_13280 [Caulobacter sp.]|nr:hypothetical protein [Caulobacter sp.]